MALLRTDINSDTDVQRAAVVGGTWVPTDLGSKLVGWLKADSITNGAVASWTDTVSGAVIPQATGANQPTKAATSFNSAYGGVTHTTDDYLLLAPVTASWPVGASSVELWAVVDQKSLAADTIARTFFGYGGGTTPTFATLQRRVTAGVNRAQVVIANLTVSDTAVDFSGPHVVAGVAYGTTVEIWVDGVLRSSLGSSTLNTAAVRTVIGGNTLGPPPTLFAEVCIRHLFVVAGTLTTTAAGEKEKLFGWCHWDSNLQSLLPPAHTYRNARP